MARPKPPPGMQPLFGRAAPPPPGAQATAPAPPPTKPQKAEPAELRFVEPRSYLTFSPKVSDWRGTGSALVRKHVADPRLLAKDYGKGLMPPAYQFGDTDVELRASLTLKGKVVKFTKRCVFPVVFKAGENDVRVDLMLAAYASVNGRVFFLDTGLGGAPEDMWTAEDPITAAADKAKAADATLLVACFLYDHDSIRKLVVTDPKSATAWGCMRAMGEAVASPSKTGDNEALRKFLETTPANLKLEPWRRKLLKADQAEWPALVKKAAESLG